MNNLYKKKLAFRKDNPSELYRLDFYINNENILNR